MSFMFAIKPLFQVDCFLPWVGVGILQLIEGSSQAKPSANALGPIWTLVEETMVQVYIFLMPLDLDLKRSPHIISLIRE